MLTILTENSSAANQFLFEMRHKDIQKHKGRFRNNMKRLGIAMALKISEKLSYRQVSVETPLGSKLMEVLAEDLVLVTILRAGSPFLEGFQEIFDEATVGFIGAYRLESEGTSTGIEMNYKALPETKGKTVFLIDPMLATGHSMIDAALLIHESGMPRKIFFISAVAAPEGVNFIREKINVPYEIWTGSLDEKLNASAYIVPGLGDAGDLSYGPKI